MGEPNKITTPVVKADAYVKVEAGAYEGRKDKFNTNVDAVFGGEIKKGGTYAKAEAGYGTALKAGIEAGHEFNIGKNIGLELSANAQYLRDNAEKSYSSTLVHDYTINTPTDTGNIHYENSVKKSWHDGFKKLGASAMLNFKGKAGNVKVGLEGGYRTNNAPDIRNQLGSNVQIDVYTDDAIYSDSESMYNSDIFKGKRSGAYITPKVSAELNLGKNSHWSLTANADRFQGNAGIKYTF